MYDDFVKLTNYKTIHGWLLIDMRTFKHVVLNQCAKWINMFKDHLLNYVLNRLNVSNWFRLVKCDRCKYIVQKIWCSLHKTPSTHFHYDVREFVCCLQELEEFIINSNEVLSLVFDWDDSNSLLRILNVLNQIKDYEPSIKNLFPSLKKIIYMLMQYDIRIPKKCLNQVNHISYVLRVCN